MIQHTSFKRGYKGAAQRHAKYIAGEGRYSDKSDVIYCVDKNLPSWSENASQFFAAADRYERADYVARKKNVDGEEFQAVIRGRAYLEIEWSIPRNIVDFVTWSALVADDLLADRHPYRLAIHSCDASDGGKNIHLHLMFSDRVMDGVERSRELFFKRANSGCYRNRKTGKLVAHDAATGGAAKSRFWNRRETPAWIRDKYESLVRREIPDFRLTRSVTPEPKIGPLLPGSSLEYIQRRLCLSDAVNEMRRLKREIAEIDRLIIDVALPIPVGWAEFEAEFRRIGRLRGISEERLETSVTALEPATAQILDAIGEAGQTVSSVASVLIDDLVMIIAEIDAKSLDSGEDDAEPGP